jgi:hypothetical protein
VAVLVTVLLVLLDPKVAVTVATPGGPALTEIGTLDVLAGKIMLVGTTAEGPLVLKVMTLSVDRVGVMLSEMVPDVYSCNVILV